MIDVALKFLVAELNGFILARTGAQFGKAELGRLVDDNGKWAGEDDQVVVALINVEEERALRSQVPQTVFSNGHNISLEPELRINLHVLLAANFRRYDQGLRQLSHALTFFQANPSFAADHYPGLDSRIEKLSVELQSLGYEQLNQVWGYIGGKHLPSVVYRVRLVVLQDLEPVSVGPPITEVVSEVHER